MFRGWAFDRELALWAAAGRRLKLWWRDDDVRAPTPQLDRLIALSRKYETPLTLAVVPDADCVALAARLACERQVLAIQHGVDHRDADPGAPSKSEFPPRYPREVMETRLVEARRRLGALPRFAPVFAPPWNAVHPDLADVLGAGGYRGLSGFGQPMSSHRGFIRLDVHLSLVGECGEARFGGAGALLSRFTALARERRHSGRWDEPLGLLTHHLEHSEAAWRFLEALLDRTTGAAAIQWRSLTDLIADERRGRAAGAANPGGPSPTASNRSRVRA